MDLIYDQINCILMKPILEIKHINKVFVKKSFFGSQKYTVKAVDDVSFNVLTGEVFVIAGESGSGKSTIAKLILGSIKPNSGKIFFEGNEIKNHDDLKKIRTGCQMIQQDPYDSINPRMRISEIISEPLEIHNIKDKDYRKKRILEVLNEVKLQPAEQIANKHPHMLSGGQRQRVVLARALAIKPRAIIADEPVSMLDVSIRAEILELMNELKAKYNISFIYITHDLATARHFGQRIAILYKGKIVEEGPINEVLLKPAHPYTQALIDAISEPDPNNINREKKIRIKETKDLQIDSGCKFRGRCPYEKEKCTQEPTLNIKDNRKVACFFPLD